MRMVLAVLLLLGQLVLSTPAHAERAFANANAIAGSRASDCGAGQVPKNGGCQNLPAGALAPKCPSGVADGNGGCAPGQGSAAPPAQVAVVSNVRPPTSIQPLGNMQVPWTVSIHPATNYVPIGNCLAVYIDLFDAAKKDIPRNPIGQRVGMADFDWTATGNAAVGKYDGPNAWAVCACPGAAVGSTVHVMATYPAASVPEKARVPGLAFQSYIELPVSKAPGTNVPAGCDNVLVTTTVATSVPGGQTPTGGPPGQGPLVNPPAAGSTAVPVTPTGVTATPATPAAQGQTPYQGTPLPANLPPAQIAPAPATPVGTTVATQPSPPSGTAYPPPGSSSSAPPAASTPAPAPMTNRYRVVATGFRVLHQTKDDMLSGDGHGDEIYGGFMVFSYDRRTSKPTVGPYVMRSNVIGETGFWGQKTGRSPDIYFQVPFGRAKGGTATGNGGFAQGDVYPEVADPSRMYGSSVSISDFPYEIYNGSLTDGQDAIIIEPSLWEADGNRDGFAKWVSNESTSAIQVWADPGVQAAVAGTQLALISPSGILETSFGPHINPGEAFGLAISGLGPIGLLTGGSYDRPIGVGESGIAGIGFGNPVLPRRAIVLTHEIVEATLAKAASYNPASVPPATFNIFGGSPVTLPAPPPGTIAVQLFEKPTGDLQAMYILYLKVERVQ